MRSGLFGCGENDRSNLATVSRQGSVTYWPKSTRIMHCVWGVLHNGILVYRRVGGGVGRGRDAIVLSVNLNVPIDRVPCTSKKQYLGVHPSSNVLSTSAARSPLLWDLAYCSVELPRDPLGEADGDDNQSGFRRLMANTTFESPFAKKKLGFSPLGLDEVSSIEQSSCTQCRRPCRGQGSRLCDETVYRRVCEEAAGKSGEYNRS